MVGSVQTTFSSVPAPGAGVRPSICRMLELLDEDVVDYLAREGAGRPYRLAQAAMDLAFALETRERGIINSAKNDGLYRSLLSSLSTMMRVFWEPAWRLSSPEEISALLGGVRSGLVYPPGTGPIQKRWLESAGLATACLQALESNCLDSIRDDFLTLPSGQRRTRLQCGDILVFSDPKMNRRAAGLTLKHPDSQCEPYETFHLRRYAGDPESTNVIWHTEYAQSITELLQLAADGGNPKLATGTPVDASTHRLLPSEGFVPTPDSSATLNTLRLLAGAANESVQVLVLPELSIADYERIRDELRASKLPALIVPGTRAEASSRGGYRNIASLWYCGRLLFDYQKIHAMHAGVQPSENAKDPWNGRQPELCVPGNTLSVLWSPEWTATVVICSDLFNPRINEAIRRTRTNLVLVPLLSPKLDGLADKMESIAFDNQAVAVASNSVHPQSGSEQGTSAVFTPMATRPTWRLDEVGVLCVHPWS